MKITVLSENTSCREDCGAEHGLSLLVQTGGVTVLFDTGQSGLFARNARTLGVELEEVTHAVVSHGHYDHGGGVAAFLELNSHAPVWLSQYAFEPHYNGAEKYIGLDGALAHSGRVRPLSAPVELCRGVSLMPWGDRPTRFPVDSFGLGVMEGSTVVPDDFRHEIYMLVEENGRRILLSGCSHRGVVNIVSRFMPDVLVGGFHFMKLDPAADGGRLREQASLLCEGATQYYTCHCTGGEQYEFLRPLMGERLHRLSAGMSVVI